MELVEVEITALVITSRYGTLSTGDILKTDQAFADHLVNDCKGAKWPERAVVSADSVAGVVLDDPTDGASGEPPSGVVDPVVPDPVAPAEQEKAASKPPKKAPK